ncbi:MAG: MtaA/CmuA family methyltransferase [Euryarchaeota archaeon]|nr:MtaA/CmuA family methyltransferase [Euryarchaeota archaeon]
MTEKERLFGALDRTSVDRVPCASPLQTGTVELMEKAQAWWPEAHIEPRAMARLAKASHTFAGIESVRVPFDVTVDASAFGARTGMERIDRQPAVIAPVFPSDARLDIDVPDPLRDGRSPMLLAAIRELKEDPDLRGTPVICGVTGPFMLSCQLRGIDRAMIDVVVEPELIVRMLESATEWCVSFIDEAIRAGADVIALTDATSSGDILSPEQYRSFALPYQRAIAERIAFDGSRSVLHICGDTSRDLDMMADCGFGGVSVDQCMDMRYVSMLLKGRAACIGNVSPTTTLLSKRTSDVEYETMDAMRKGTDVVAPGCGFAPRTPLANMRAMANTVKMSAKRP